MTVNANPAVSGPYLTDGVTRAWPFGFKIVDASHIKIVAVNIATGVETEYKVGLVVPPGDINQDNGGAVTYPAAPTAALPTGFEIYTVRDVPFSQPNQIGNQGNFFPETHEKTFDLLAMQNQQTLEIARRAVIAGYGQDPSTFVDDLLQASATAVAAAQAAAADAVQTAADRVQTGLDRVQTGLDRVATAADRVATAADRVQTGADAVATAADRVQTGLDRTAASGFASATAADRIQTGLDATATAADRVQTGADAVATAADRVQTGLDRAAAAASAASVNPAVIRMGDRSNGFVDGTVSTTAENGATVGSANGYFVNSTVALYRSSGPAGKATLQQITNYSSDAGSNTAAELKCATTHALAAGDFVAVSGYIEGAHPVFKAAKWGTAGAKPIMFRCELTGTLAGVVPYVHVVNRASNRHMWVVPTITGNILEAQLPGDTTGTWSIAEGEIGAQIDLVWVMGSTFVGGTAGVWGASAFYGGATRNFLTNTSNVARMTDFGLRNDPDNTGVYGLYRVEVDGAFQALRYWEAGQYQFTVYQVEGSAIDVPISFFRKSKAPNIALNNTSYINASAATSIDVSNRGFNAQCIATASGTARVRSSWVSTARPT